MTEPLRFEVDYHEYYCTACTSDGCFGHMTNIPVAIGIDSVFFCVAGHELGNYPSILDQEAIKRVKQAVEHLQNTLALAAVSGGEFCAEARAAGRGPCGACSWCVKQAQERAERAEAEVERLRRLHPTHLTVED
jgi:hypothetical protein